MITWRGYLGAGLLAIAFNLQHGDVNVLFVGGLLVFAGAALLASEVHSAPARRRAREEQQTFVEPRYTRQGKPE